MIDWIATENQLPMFDEEVLVYVPEDLPDMVIACYRGGPNGPYWDYVDVVLSDITGEMETDPTHWSYKPRPPK